MSTSNRKKQRASKKRQVREQEDYVDVPIEENVQEEENQENVVQPSGFDQQVLPGYYLDVRNFDDIEGNLLENLKNLGWLDLLQFNCTYYPELVIEFYKNCTLVLGDLSIKSSIGGQDYVINAMDFVDAFDIPITKRVVDSDDDDDDEDVVIEDLVQLDIPNRKWSSNWPLNYKDSVDELNNGREHRFKTFGANKMNLRGSQRFAYKLVSDIILPSNNKDMKLTYVLVFLTSCIVHNVQIHLPSLIMYHMTMQKKKEVLPYGMILSYLLMRKGVDVSVYGELQVPHAARIGVDNLSRNEIYVWEKKLWSKWEVWEKFFDV